MRPPGGRGERPPGGRGERPPGGRGEGTPGGPGEGARGNGPRLLPRLLLAFVAVLLVAAVVAVIVETGLARQQVADEALELTTERGAILARRIQQEGASTRQQLLTLSQQLQLDARDEAGMDRVLLETLALTRVSGARAEIGAIIDLRAGQVRAALPGRTALADPGPLALELLGTTPESSTRVVPTRADGYALIHVQAVRRLDASASLLAIGYPLDDGRARLLREDLGVDGIEVVVDGAVVASTAPAADRTPVGDPSVRGATQEATNGRLVRYVPIGSERGWDTPAAIGVISADPLGALGRSLDRTRLLTVAIAILVGGVVALGAARVLTRPISELTTTAAAIAAGDLGRSFDVPDRRDEIGTLARALEHMRQELRTQLQVIADQATDLQDAARRIVGAQDRERRRIAHDLHDGLQHQLVVLRMRIGALRQQVDDPAAIAAADELALAVEQILDQVRSTGQQLFPSILRDRGLGGALHSLAGRSATRVEVILEPDPLPRLPEDVEVGAYFMLAEAVTNALRHADATSIRIEVGVTADQLSLTVTDDGVGFVPDEQPSGGTRHLQDRAHALGGRFELRSVPGTGTVVTAVLPLDPERAT